MKRYLYLQFKKVFKLFPFLLAVTLVLIITLGVILGGIINDDNKEKEAFNIAVSGDRDNNYFKIGLSALQNMDQTRFSINVIEMDESKAEKAIKNGEISAYVVLPDNFIEKALSGNVQPIKYVTTAGAMDVTTLFKNEVTTVITEMVIASQKGSYGMAAAMEQNGITDNIYDHMTALSIRYVKLILNRGDMITVETLGTSRGVTLAQYYICGIFILLIMLIGLPFAPLFIKRDNSLSRLLVSKGYKNFIQLLCEYIANLSAFIILLAVIFSALGIMTDKLEIENNILNGVGIWNFALSSLPIVVMIVSFNIMVFEIASNIVSGMLLHFFATVGLCYVSGCFYPITAFPKVIQKLADFLPTGVAFDNLTSLFNGEGSISALLGVILYAVLFFCIALMVRSIKTINYKRSVKGAKVF